MRSIILTSAVCVLFCSCYKEYRRTEKVCDQKLYMEIYERNQLGISYLTDSTNFNLYIGQLNFENERYSYKCTSDSVFIYKVSRGSGNALIYYKIVEEHKFNIKELQKRKD